MSELKYEMKQISGPAIEEGEFCVGSCFNDWLSLPSPKPDMDEYINAKRDAHARARVKQ